MTNSQKISLLTLIGLVLPLGNVWGPFLMKTPKGTYAHKFRIKLVISELLLTIVFYAVALSFSTRGISSAVDANVDTDLLSTSLKVILILQLVIIAAAIALTVLTRKCKD